MGWGGCRGRAKKDEYGLEKRVYKRCYKVQIEVSVGSQCQSVNVSKGCGKLWPCFRAVAECRGGRGVKSRQGFNSIRTHTILIVQQKRGNMATLLLLFFFFCYCCYCFFWLPLWSAADWVNCRAKVWNWLKLFNVLRCYGQHKCVGVNLLTDFMVTYFPLHFIEIKDNNSH